MKSGFIYFVSVSFIFLAGWLLVGCEAWELPSPKTQRNCVKPGGSLEAQIQQRKVDFSVSNGTGTIDQVIWDFGNESLTVTTGITVTYTYPAVGTFSVKATLSNTCGQETILARTVSVADVAVPTVSLQPDPAISINSATIGMTITSTGNATISSYGICYSNTNTTPERGKNDAVVLERPGSVELNKPVSFTAVNLLPNTLYYVRSFAVNQARTGSETGYSTPVRSFRTGSIPSVDNAGATNIGVRSANANFVVTNSGNPAAIEYGICYSSSNPLPEVGNSPSIQVTTPTVGTNTSVALTNLNPNTTYYYRSYAKLPSGEIEYLYSPTVDSFTTLVDTLSQDLVASISFTDESRLDDSGHKNHINFVDNPIFVEDRKGRPNSAIQLDGKDDYFYMTENNSLRPASLTISIWIKPITVKGRMQIYNKSRFIDGSNEMYSSLIQPEVGGTRIAINTDIKQNSNCQEGVGWQSFMLTSSIELNTWHHLVLVYGGRSARMYFDNAELGIKPDLPRDTMDQCVGGELKFGAQSLDYPNYFYGAMDDIRIYSRALTRSEVQALYNQ